MDFAEIWKQDVGDLFQIAPSTQGIQNVHLKCGSNSMIVKLETAADFTGVMYTKGNFYDQASSPCFSQSKNGRGNRNLSMRFTFDQCNTKYDGNVFTNTIIVQNDPELVTPGEYIRYYLWFHTKVKSIDIQCLLYQNNEIFKDKYIHTTDSLLIITSLYHPSSGDSAFALQCDFRKPRSLNVEANYETDR